MGKHTSFILAGYPEDMDNLIKANPGLQRRFDTTITFSDYSDEELADVRAFLLMNMFPERARARACTHIHKHAHTSRSVTGPRT